MNASGWLSVKAAAFLEKLCSPVDTTNIQVFRKIIDKIRELVVARKKLGMFEVL